MKIIYNGKNKEECVSLDALENSSTLFSSGAPAKKVVHVGGLLF